MNNSFGIKRAEVSSLRAPLLQPFRIATGQHDSLDNLLITLELNSGVKAYGEAAVASHITGETLKLTRRNLERVSHFLKGKEIGDYLKISAYLHEVLADNKAALAAVEMALYDAIAKSLKMPLWKVWGHKPALLRADITIVIADLAETVEKAKSFYAKGFRAFKIKVGRDMDLDIKRAEAVSRIVGKSQIIIDANQAYTPREALGFLRAIAKRGVNADLIEQPVKKQDWDGLKEVTRLSKICVCADESAGSLPEVIRIIKEKAAGAINIKLMKTGIVHSVAIARWAKASGVKLMIGGMMESNLAMTAAAHMAAGIGGIDFIDLDTPFFIKGAVAKNPYLSIDGTYRLSATKPGIGITPI